MAKSAKFRIGIDIGTNAIKVASYHAQKKRMKLSKLLKFDFLQEDIVQNVTDVNETHVMTAVKNMLNELPYRRASIRVGLSSDFHNIFCMQVPQVAQHELKQTLYWELTPLLPGPVENYEYDYTILPQTEKKKLNILLAVMKTSRMEWLDKLFKSLSTQMDILETPVLPAVDLFFKSNPKQSDTVGFLQLGASNSSYTIVDSKNHPEFLFIPFGGNTMNSNIADQRDIPFAEAEFLRLGIRHTSAYGNEETVEEARERQEAMEVSRTALYMENEEIAAGLKNLSRMVKQMNMRHDYQTGETVSRIYVTGGLLNDDFVGKFFRFSNDFFDVPSEVWDPIETYYPHLEADSAYLYQFGPAIGLAVR